MKKVSFIAAILAVAALLIYGCSSSSTPQTKTLPDLTAQSYSQIGINLTQDITGAMGEWAITGNITGLSVKSVKGASVSGSTVTTDPDGWLHLTEVATSPTGTFNIDLYITTEADILGNITDIYVYGTYAMNISSGGTTIAYSQTWGTAKNKTDACHGSVTWTGSDVTQVSVNGKMSFSVNSNSVSGQTSVAMTFNFSNLTVPVTAGDDYPSGSIVISGITYKGPTDAAPVAQPDITITFSPPGYATITFGTEVLGPFQIDPS